MTNSAGRSGQGELLKSFKNLSAILKDLQPLIQSPRNALEKGRRSKTFGGALIREVVGNWLICAVANSENPTADFTTTTDPTGGDGILHNRTTGDSWPTEHVMVPDFGKDPGKSSEDRILSAIDHKQSRGAKYAGKTLVVFSYAAGTEWHPDRIFRRLPKESVFDAVWVFGLQYVVDGSYTYGLPQLAEGFAHMPTWTVRIKETFDNWTVRRCQ